MEDTLNKIKAAEKKAQEHIAEAKKHHTAELNAAIEEAEKGRKNADQHAGEIISKAIAEAEERAKVQAQKMSASRTEELEKLKSNVHKRMDTAVEKIAGAFGTWQ